MIPGIPTQTLFNPQENYPPGVLRSAVIQLPGSGDTLDIQFFPECQEVVFATDNRTSDTVSLREERLKKWNCSRTTRGDDSWSLDEISSEKTKWKDGNLQVEWDRDKCEMLKDDIAKIEEILDWQERDLRDMDVGADELLQRVPDNEEMDEWLDAHTFTEEEEAFFENEIASMNLHHLRASSGPPTDDYYMRVSYDKDTGLPTEGGQCWRTEEWCPEMGRMELMRVPENYGCFSTFNPHYKPFGIQWPEKVAEKTEEECYDRRFSGLQSCGRWMQWIMDNDGRFVANGVVKEKVPFSINSLLWGCIVETEYGLCILPEHRCRGLQIGDKIKILCRDNDMGENEDIPIRSSKIIAKGPKAHEDFASVE